MLDKCAVITVLMKQPENNFQVTVGCWRSNFLHYALNIFLYHYLATMISLIYCKIRYLNLPILYLVCNLIHYLATMISLIYCKICYLYLTILYLICNLIHLKMFKSLSNCNTFLSFKGSTHPHLLQIRKTNNKKRIPLLNLLIYYEL